MWYPDHQEVWQKEQLRQNSKQEWQGFVSQTGFKSWRGEGHANHRRTLERVDWHLAHMNCILSRICLDSSFWICVQNKKVCLCLRAFIGPLPTFPTGFTHWTCYNWCLYGTERELSLSWLALLEASKPSRKEETGLCLPRSWLRSPVSNPQVLRCVLNSCTLKVGEIISAQ